MENLHSGHRKRLKQSFLDNGLSSFQPHNVLELLLFYARPRIDTNEIAHRLLNNFKSLSGVFNAPYEELVKVEGLGENGAVLLKLIPQLLNIYSVDMSINEPMNSLKAVCNFFYGCYIGVKTEQLKVCCLDDNLHVVSCATVEDGGVNTVPVNVRKIVEATYRSNCSLIILAHNHPNGTAIPSDKDIQVTRQLTETLEAVGIKLLDHVIVGPKNAISMKEAGYFNIFD
ncbi:MAG: JAB domain-containing protein [Oscillospiraceae bacterium]|jgi:DNA repair protein RadC